MSASGSVIIHSDEWKESHMQTHINKVMDIVHTTLKIPFYVRYEIVKALNYKFVNDFSLMFINFTLLWNYKLDQLVYIMDSTQNYS